MADNDYIVVTAISTHRMRYVMHEDDLRKLNADATPDKIELIDWALDTVTMEECEGFSQHWLGEQIVDVDILDEHEILELFDKDNDYLKDWDRDYKIQHIRRSIQTKEIKKETNKNDL